MANRWMAAAVIAAAVVVAGCGDVARSASDASVPDVDAASASDAAGPAQDGGLCGTCILVCTGERTAVCAGLGCDFDRCVVVFDTPYICDSRAGHCEPR